ncbi:DUF692 family multinuclear iron-containing protein [Pseudomonas aeruginosa]
MLRAIKGFIEQHDIRAYSEHLSACADDGQLYDLIHYRSATDPGRAGSPNRSGWWDVLEAAVDRRERLGGYARLPGELEEVDFVRAVLEEADCQLLLDVNNVYVNACNFGFDAHAYIAAMPSREDRLPAHGRARRTGRASLKIDTMARRSAIRSGNCWHMPMPSPWRTPETLLERDYNLPPLSELYAETDRIRELQRRSGEAQLRSLGYGT